MEGDAKLEFIREGKNEVFGRRRQVTVGISQRSTDSYESEEGSFRGSAERSNWIEGEGEYVGFQEASVTSDVREFRERFKTKESFGMRKRKDARRGPTALTTTMNAKGFTIARHMRRSLGAGKRCANRIFVNQARKRKSSTR